METSCRKDRQLEARWIYRCWYLTVLVLLIWASFVDASEIFVTNSDELSAAIKDLKAGDTVVLAPGEFRGPVRLIGLKGTEDHPVVLRGRDPRNPPIISGGGLEGIQIRNCSYVTVRSVMVREFSANGINIDDGGSYESPSHHIRLESVSILETGPQGNCDALKMSGVDDFEVRGCRFAGWGGSAIDMVGCHDGVVEECHFEGKTGYSQYNGVQMKGGSCGILIKKCFFRNAGQEAVKIGGHTGLKWFRPQGVPYEAKNIEIAGNRIVRSKVSVSWIAAVDGSAHHNTIVFPMKFVLRITQGDRKENFLPCSNGVFASNLIVFQSKLRRLIGIDAGTLPQTFRFYRNAWFQVDGEFDRELPVEEQVGVYQVDPQLDDFDSPTMTIRSGNPALRGIGASGYTG